MNCARRWRRPEPRPAWPCNGPIAVKSEYRDTLEIIEQQTARLSRIVDDMFMLARADAGNFPIRKTPMYLDEVLDEVVRAARVLSRARQIEIRPEESKRARR